MPYERQISRQHKGCFLFLVNQSRTMLEPIGGGGRRKCDEAASQVNAWLYNMTIRATGSDGIRDWMDVGVLGYRTDDEGKPIIESAFQGALADRSLASVVDLGEHPARVEQVIRRFVDEETEEILDWSADQPVWVDPKAEGGAPMCRALHEAFQLLQGWISHHRDSFPPIVIHVTDGQSHDGDPTSYADALKNLATSDGNVLLFNGHFSRSAVDPVIFPSSREMLPDAAARLSFDLSSRLPAPLFKMAVSQGFELQPGARGMAFNTDMTACIKGRPINNFPEFSSRLGRRYSSSRARACRTGSDRIRGTARSLGVSGG
ncbi:MAG TPA: vWA domain-containing protein, partial [Thermoguttaceae bacterium]|nr:vWA domain-containing protein [Thermoguttaceae bacterium]